MSEITETQRVDIRRTVSVRFDADNRPEFDRGGKHYCLTEARIEYRLLSGVWRKPFSLTSARQQRVKDGSWGKEVWASQYLETDLIDELADEYRPTAKVTVTETNTETSN